MKKIRLVSVLMLVCFLTVPSQVFAEHPPEMIFEKMVIKSARGWTNIVTSPVELIPKQIVLTGREMGPVGYIVVGPAKGAWMMVYRAFVGVAEAVFFMIPQPGYYDPTIDPAYVWEGWEPKRDTSKELIQQEK